MAYRFTSNREEAEDMTQEIFVKLWRRLPSYDPRKDFTAWFLTLARNFLIDEYRKTKLEKGLRDEFDDRTLAHPSTDGPEESFARMEARQTLMNYLAGLAPEMRNVIIMRDIEGRSYEEIARMLDMPLGTIKSRINRARLSLAELVRARKGGPE